jgi:2-polyprenyl-3-methyl-5-hydroxy-6-metoxy-1,4-benzoquinol methylase
MKFIKVPLKMLASIPVAKQEDISLDVYCGPNPLFREFFWLRLRLLTLLMNWVKPKNGRALDFGGGSGIMAPTLSQGFDRVDLIDLHADEADYLIKLLNIQNVFVNKTNILEFDYGQDQFDMIIAADVLEHFQDLNGPLPKIKRWIKPDGYLFTSLPTENIWYRVLRIIFRKEKPWDHYHTAAHVEATLKKHGFKKVAGIYHPLLVPLFPLFRISAWRKIASQ